MTKEEVLRVANEIAQRMLTFGRNVAGSADGAEAARVEAERNDEVTQTLNAERRRADSLASTINYLRGILGAKPDETTLDAARRCAQAVRPWRPISELVKDGRRVEVWNGTAPTFAHADFGNSAVYTHFREIDRTKPEGVA